MKKLVGDTSGLKVNQIRRLEKFYRRRIPPEFVITPEFCRDISLLSHEIGRQIGVLSDRSGKVTCVIVGDQQRIVIPDISEYRLAPGRLRGLKCIHTHLKNEQLTKDDLTDLALLRLDVIAAVTMTQEGRPHQVHVGHILPGSSNSMPCRILDPMDPAHLDIGCRELINALEAELAQLRSLIEADTNQERGFLVSVTTETGKRARESLSELSELAGSAGIHIIDKILQLRKKVDSKFLIGRGKLDDLTILALHKGATMLIFDQELNPSQIRVITERTELKVIDRTQLILDIFAQRAMSREGKLQVELAQLKYLLPRLVLKNTAMSRLTGGIGGRGPGETKLEINRRRVRDRIRRLEKSLSSVKKQRRQQKARRNKKGLPVISIIGYTNAGKSTLLNTLTNSEVLSEDRLFATLDPTSRRLRFPKDIEVIITDTVGFIRALPKELMAGFRATLEELESANLLLHVIDISNPRYLDQIKSVKKILEDLNLNNIATVNVLNKQDLVDKKEFEKQIKELDGIMISAKKASTLKPLVDRITSNFY